MSEQGTLIYIYEKDEINASITAKEFTKEEVRNRVYYNSLGAQLAQKFLASENVDVSNIYNIHNIRKILENFDISDIMLNNIHIDVRVIFNENYIFIPKSHFNYEIQPDIYLVLLMSNDKKYMKFLGFFEPKLINKNNQNENFYFIEKEKLTSPVNLKTFIERFDGNTEQNLSDDVIEEADIMMLSMVDHDITEEDKKALLKNLVKSAKLRDRFIEFENFELLAYGAQTSPDIEIPIENHPRTLDFAASATAVALQEFNNANSEPFSESGMSNGFADIERELPGLTPESDEINSEFDISDIVEASEENSTDFSAESEFEQNTGSIEEFTSQYGETVSEEDSMLNDAFDETFKTQNQSDDFSIDELTELSNSSETDQRDISIVEFNDVVETEDITDEKDSNSEIETVTLDEIPLSDNVSNDQNLGVITETVDINEISENEIKPVVNNEVVQETVDFEEIPLEDNTESSTIADEPELQTFDNLNIEDSQPIQKAVELETETQQKVENVEIPEISKITGEIEPEQSVNTNDELFSTTEQKGLLTQIFHKELGAELTEASESQSEEKSTFEQLNELEEDFDTTQQSENLTEFPDENQTAENSAELNEDEKIIMPEDMMISDEDKELDEMLNIEDFGGIEEIKPQDGELSIEQSETLPVAEIANNKTEEEISVKDTELTEINEQKPKVIEDTVADLDISVNEVSKESLIGGVEYEGNPEISTGELISQIDDLLSSEEEESNNNIQNENQPEPSTIKNIELSEASITEKPDEPMLLEEGDDDKLEVLFNSTIAQNNEEINNIDSDMLSQDDDSTENEEDEEYEDGTSSSNSKKTVIVAAAAFLALIAVSAGGFFWWKSNNNNELAELMDSHPIENDTLTPSSGPDPDLSSDTPNKSDLLANAPAPTNNPVPKEAPAMQPTKTVTQPAAQKSATQSAKQKATATSTKTEAPKTITGTPIANITVRNLTWEVPDYLSYSEEVKKYLQTAGKSIRLTLSSDLLLATEYAYSSRIKVSIRLKNDGTVKDAQIVQSSGSNQINDIVLRTVKDTLKVVKPASGEIPTPNFKLGLIINI